MSVRRLLTAFLMAVSLAEGSPAEDSAADSSLSPQDTVSYEDSATGLSTATISAVDKTSTQYFPLLAVTQRRFGDTAITFGSVIIPAGYCDGIDTGMVGAICRYEYGQGYVDLASLHVASVTGNEAVCRFELLDEMRVPTINDRARLQSRRHSAESILQRAMAAYENRRFAEALGYLDKLYCQDTSNNLVTQLARECFDLVETEETQTFADPEHRPGEDRAMGYIMLAQRYWYLANWLMADWYMRKAYLIDSTNETVAQWRQKIPSVDHFVELNRVCSSRLPRVDEFVPVEIIAEMVRYETPIYPKLAEQAGFEGIVWIKSLVDTDGRVRDAVIYKSSGYPALDRAALDAAPGCRFKPAIANSAPIAMWVTYKVQFILNR